MPTSNINHIMLFRLAYTVFIFFTLIVIGIVIIYWYPFTPIVYEKAVLKQNQVKTGDVLTYTAHFKKYANRVGTMQRWLVCEKQATQSLDYGLADASVDDTFKTVTVEIPKTTLPGKCKVKWTVGYDYYGLRTIPTRFETPQFEVVK
jgi:hypothetical protein